MILQEIYEKVADTKVQNTYLYFVTRILKPDVKKTAKMLGKYEFKVYQIDINDEIRTHLHNLTLEQLENTSLRKTELHPYEVITDDTQILFSYEMDKRTLSFADIVENQLKSKIPKVVDLEELIEKEELWAYCIGFNYNRNAWTYAFRKITPSKVAIDEKDGNSRPVWSKTLRTIFNTKSNKLELLQGQTINLDKNIDCVYYQNMFYVLRKTQFEQIVGIEEEFKEEAIRVASILQETQMIDGVDLIISQIESQPSLHRKLARLSKLDHCRSLDARCIRNMKKIAKEFGENLKVKNGKLHIEDEKDIEVALKMLGEYYKEGRVFGVSYGTFSGKVLSTNGQQK